MNRFPRVFTAAVVVFALLVVASPAAQARPLGKPHTTLRVLDGNWLEAALAWLGSVLGAQPEPETPLKSGSRRAQTDIGIDTRPVPPPQPPPGTPMPQGMPGGGCSAQETGVCIDPNG
jgi:hypothetical protein